MLERLRLSAALVEDGNSVPKVDVRQLITNSNSTPGDLTPFLASLGTDTHSSHAHMNIHTYT